MVVLNGFVGVINETEDIKTLVDKHHLKMIANLFWI